MMAKIYELVYLSDCGYFQVALSMDKALLQSMIEQVKAIDDDYKKRLVRFENGDDEALESFKLPSDFILYRIDGFNVDDVYCDDDGCADNLKIWERELLEGVK